MRWERPAALVLATCSLLVIAQQRPALGETGVDRPNILFISVDDLNDWLGCTRGQSPAGGLLSPLAKVNASEDALACLGPWDPQESRFAGSVNHEH